MKVEIDKALFNAVYVPLIDDYTDTQIIFGGAASGKSRFVAQRAVIRLLQGRNLLVVRKVAATLRTSTYSEIAGVINEWKLDKFFEFRIGSITCVPSQSQAIFVGLDNAEKIKSIRPANGSFHDVWVEEATEISYSDYRQLRLRQRGKGENKVFTMTFNPILRSHWINEKIMIPAGWTDEQNELIGYNLHILKTTYKHNRFLTLQDRERLESENDKYWRDVYVLGKWGVLGNVIFTNWTIDDLDEMRRSTDSTELLCGLDFGYAKDPAAIVVLRLFKNDLYVLAEYCQTGMTNPQLAEVIREMVGDAPIYCDSAEPKSIAELRSLGINAYPAKKGHDSVRYGIQWLQQRKIIVDRNAISVQNELASYKWRENSAGEVANPPTPVDKDNHTIDAIRYALTPILDIGSVEYAPSIWR